jgi:uncharacterized membrane protein
MVHGERLPGSAGADGGGGADALGDAARAVLLWVVVSLVLDLVTVGITVGINVPANDRLKVAGDVDAIDVAAARAEFDEGRWTRWNLVRVVLSVVAFAALWDLVLAGRLW